MIRVLKNWLSWVFTRMPDWKRLGSFTGEVNLTYVGARDYLYIPNPEAPLTFERGTHPTLFIPSGEIIQPRTMHTDGGSIPRPAWLLPSLDPWQYFPAYLIHDWEFDQHHLDADYAKSFEDVNQTLVEAVYTLMMARNTYSYWGLRAIYRGVSSPIGRDVWNGAWVNGRA